MRYALYEDPQTHTFALLALPSSFVDGDKFPITDVERWFGSRKEAIAAVPDLLNREERGADPLADPQNISVADAHLPERKTIQ